MSLWLLALIVAASVGLVLLVGLSLDIQPCDDAYISFRYAKNLADGPGLVFNPGERVEGITNFLFTVLIGVGQMAGLRPELGALILNLFGFALLVLLLVRYSAQTARTLNSGRLGVPLFSTALLLASPAMLYFTFIGLETIFYTAVLTAGVFMFLTALRTRRGFLLAGVVFGLAAAIRMEAVLVALVVAVTLALSQKPRTALKNALLVAGGMASILTPINLFRFLYYGNLLPNTYYAKMYGGEFDSTGRGLLYFAEFWSMHFVLAFVFLAAAALWVLRRTPRRETGFLLGFVGIFSAYTVWVGGDFFPWFRFFVPVIPALGMLAVRVLTALMQSTAMRSWVWACVGAGAISATALATYSAPAHLEMAAKQQFSVRKRAQVGETLREILPSDKTLLVGAAGAIPYFSGLNAHDFYGLTDPEVAKLRLDIGHGMPGHEKNGIWLQIPARKPDLIMFKASLAEEVTKKEQRNLEQKLRQKGRVLKAAGDVYAQYVTGLIQRDDLILQVAVKESLSKELRRAPSSSVRNHRF